MWVMKYNWDCPRVLHFVEIYGMIMQRKEERRGRNE